MACCGAALWATGDCGSRSGGDSKELRSITLSGVSVYRGQINISSLSPHPCMCDCVKRCRPLPCGTRCFKNLLFDWGWRRETPGEYYFDRFTTCRFSLFTPGFVLKWYQHGNSTSSCKLAQKISLSACNLDASRVLVWLFMRYYHLFNSTYEEKL